MKKEGKNLEALDEAYKGIFRTPFALLLGGPAGVVINAIYSAIKVKNEIKEANDFNIQREARRKGGVEYEKRLRKMVEEKEEKEAMAKQEAKYLYELGDYIKQFFKDVKNSDDVYNLYMWGRKYNGINVYDINLHCKDLLDTNNINLHVVSKKYTTKEFIEQYQRDMLDDNIKNMYKISCKYGKENILFFYTTKHKENEISGVAIYL
jgi:hypothetical protein